MASPGQSEVPAKGSKSGAYKWNQAGEKIVDALDAISGENDYETMMKSGFEHKRKEGGK